MFFSKGVARSAVRHLRSFSTDCDDELETRWSGRRHGLPRAATWVRLAPPMQPEDPTPAIAEAESIPTSLGGALSSLASHPLRWLVRYWNWKNAVLSAIARASIFFAVNLTASWDSAVDAVVTELLYRAPMVGTLASLSQVFRRVQPAWEAGVVIMFALPALAHGIEFTVHSLRGTEKLYESVAISVVFSMFTSVVSYFLHRRDVLIVGHGSRPFVDDLVQLPMELFDLLVRKPFRAAFGRSTSDET